MKYIEQSALFLILVVLAFAMLFGGWKIKHHGMD
jgi:hypothetical protein